MLTHYYIKNLLYICNEQKEQVNIGIMKYLKFLRMAPLALGLTVLISACSTQDLYEPDPEIPEQPEEPTKPSVDINWATHTTTVLNVNVNDEYNGQYYYTVEVYAAHPILDENAKMIAGSGQKTNSKVSYSREIVVPIGVETIYVVITDPFKRRWVQAVEMREGTITLDSATGNVTTKSLSMGGLRSDEIETPIYPVVDFTYDKGQCTLVSGTAFNFQYQKNYLIEKGATYSGSLSFPGNGEINLYVEGTLEISGGVVLQNNTNIYVLNGGVVKAKGGTVDFDLKQSSILAIETGAKVGDESYGFSISQITNQAKVINNGELYLQKVRTNSDGSLYNKGTLKVSGETKIDTSSEFISLNEFSSATMSMTAFSTYYSEGTTTISGKTLIDSSSEFVIMGTYTAAEMEMKGGASFINNGTTTISGKFYPKGGGVKTINYNTLIAGEIDFSNGLIENHCLIQTPKMTVGADGRVNLMSGSYIDSEDLRFYNGTVTVNMDALSMWESKTFKCENRLQLNGSPDSDFALFKTEGNFQSITWDGVVFGKKLQIEASSYSGKWKAESSVQIFEGVGTSTVVIPADKCNDNKGNKNEGEGDGDTDDEYEEDETLPYTYLFEDNWPAKGDYDMNDLVISIELRNTIKAAKTEKVKVIATLYAAGGTKILGAGYQLDGIRASSVSGGESGQDYAVFRLFDDAHAELGSGEHIQINTYRVDYAPQTITQEVAFTTPIDGVINVNNFNMFIVVDGGFDLDSRKEVHLPGFKGTKKALTSEFSTEEYIDIETGWMWGLSVPQTVFGTYPKENIPINDAYQGFDAWVTGNDAPDWYNFPVEGNVIIFEDPSEEII